MTVWGASEEYGESSTMAAGWLPEMSRDPEGAKIDPANADGLYKGPSRGHVQPRYAQLIGMPRGYGYGASMGAWVIDYLSNWGGEWSFISYSNMQYRSPALTGDATFLNAEVVVDQARRPVGKPDRDAQGGDDESSRRGDGDRQGRRDAAEGLGDPWT